MFQGPYQNKPGSITALWKWNAPECGHSACKAVSLTLAWLLLTGYSGTVFGQQAVSDADQATKAAVEKKPEPGGDASANDKNKDESINLLTEDLTKYWRVFSSSAVTPDAPVWNVIRQANGDEQELILVCSGEPKGFLYTTESYSEFELTLEWKYPEDADGNSGVLVYTQDEPRIWPTSMQVQLHQPKAGSVFPSGDATSDQTSEAEPDLARPVNVWNEGKILSRDGRLSVEVNGKKAGEVSGAKPYSGSVALQSEGSIVHFRRIRIRKLPPVEPMPKVESNVSATNVFEGFETILSHAPSLARRQNDRHIVAAAETCERSTRRMPSTSRQRRSHVQ